MEYIPPSLSKELAVKANEILGNEVYVPAVHDPDVYHISTPQVVVLAMDQVKVSVSKWREPAMKQYNVDIRKVCIITRQPFGWDVNDNAIPRTHKLNFKISYLQGYDSLSWNDKHVFLNCFS